MDAQLRLDDANLSDYLCRIGLLSPGETAAVEKAGEGNINWVRRARAAPDRSWVVKQARPALERFPEYRAPTERIVIEARYYEEVAPLDHEGICPRVVYFDPDQRVLVLEDLGDAERLDAAQARGADTGDAARALAGFLGRVHASTRGRHLAERFANEAMRRLHGDHIFVLPYRDNDFPLSPAVAARADGLRSDLSLVRCIDAACARYLEPRGVLVHGDVQPTNVLLTANGPKLVDAEIAHVGDPAFDVGILLAHLLLPGAARGRAAAAQEELEAAWSAYAAAHGADSLPAFADTARYAGIELLRRTIGAARVAGVETDAASLAVLDAGARLVRAAPASPRRLAALLG